MTTDELIRFMGLADDSPDRVNFEDYPELRNRALVFGEDIDAEEIVKKLENDADSDKVGGESNKEDNRGFLGRAYNQLKNLL
jgi:hypothetical protein